MKKWFGLMALTAAAGNVSANLLYDPFNYTAGTNLNQVTAPNGQVWSAAGNGATFPQITSASLPQDSTASASYQALAMPQGDALSHLNASTNERVALGNAQIINSGTTYYSLGIDISDVSALFASPNKAGIFLAGFNNVVGTQSGTTGTVGARLYIRPNPDGSETYDIGVSKNSGPDANTSWSTDHGGSWLPVNTTIFVVADYTIVGTTVGTDDTVSMWVNPAPSSFGQASAPATLQNTSDGATDLGVGGIGGTPTVATFDFRTAANIPPSTTVDEVRVDTTWAGVTAVEWKAAANGNWSANGDWSNGAAYPNAIGADVTFGTNSTGYNVNVDQPVTVGTLRFNGTNSYTIGGSSTLTLQEAADTGISNPAQIIVSAGNHSITAPVQINKNLALNIASGSTITLSGGATAASGISLTLGGSSVSGGNAAIKPAAASALHGLTGLSVVAGNLQFLPAHAAITTTAFSLAAASTLDLTNNDLIVDYAATGDTTTGPAVVAAVKAAYDGGLWDKPGITTSMAPAGSGKTLAVVDNESLATPISTDGLTLDASSVIVKFTWFGDLNLDGTVDGSDLTLMADGQSGWAGGDLNYDSVVNNDDWALYQLGVAQSAGGNISVTPEPSAALALAGVGLIVARRRRAVSRLSTL